MSRLWAGGARLLCGARRFRGETIFQSGIRTVRPKTAPSRGLTLGHGSAYVQSSSAAYRVTINRSAKYYRFRGRLAPPSASRDRPLLAPRF